MASESSINPRPKRRRLGWGAPALLRRLRSKIAQLAALKRLESADAEAWTSFIDHRVDAPHRITFPTGGFSEDNHNDFHLAAARFFDGRAADAIQLGNRVTRKSVMSLASAACANLRNAVYWPLLKAALSYRPPRIVVRSMCPWNLRVNESTIQALKPDRIIANRQQRRSAMRVLESSIAATRSELREAIVRDPRKHRTGRTAAPRDGYVRAFLIVSQFLPPTESCEVLAALF